MSFTIDQFFDEKDHLFYYTDKSHHNLIARKKELFDNVIPSSNSMMAANLWTLGTLINRNSYIEICNKMLSWVSGLIPKDPAYLSNWATVSTYLSFNTAEVAVGGPNFEAYRTAIAAHFHPHKVMVGGSKQSSLPLLENRIDPKSTKIYVCYNQTCQLPTTNPESAIEQLTY